MKLYTNQPIKTNFILTTRANSKQHGDVVLFKLIKIFKRSYLKYIK